MQKTKFSLIADPIFFALSAFILSFCVERYYRLPLWLCAFLSLTLSLALFFGLYFLFNVKNDKRALSKKEEENKQKLMLHLALEKSERVRFSLLQAYRADGKKTHCQNDELCVDGKIYVYSFRLEELTADEVAYFIRKYGNDFVLLCNKVSEEAQKLLSSFSVPIQDGNEIYNLFLRTQTMPDPFICGDVPRKSLKGTLRRSFSKKNARPFFVSGSLLLFMSLFMLFPVYYVITGSVLLLCSVGVRLFGYAN